ncbi:hypothetical protein FQN54_008376 [Arachnomyces sp. PD_36]|nr:hypothetical protein FQN54_008376 [Arachnomyces sp. PD_36]
MGSFHSKPAPAPIGSGIFSVLALLTISIAVLLLLRRFLPLRSTPAYLSVPVFLALALPASIVLLVPIDLVSSSDTEDSHRGIWLPDRVILVSWRIAYWLTFVLTWVILPLMGEYIDSGYRTPKDRIMYSLRSNARYQLIVLGCGLIGLIYISVHNGFDFTTIKALIMALAYVWGLVLAIYLMGHGLVSIPRSLLRDADINQKMRRLQIHAVGTHDRLTDAVTELETLEMQVHSLQRRKTGTARVYHEWIEELADMSTMPEQRAATLEATGELRSNTPTVITERYLADLTRRLNRARHQRARFVEAWDRLIQDASDTQAIINSSASKRLEFTKPAAHTSYTNQFSILTPYARYIVYVHLIPLIRRVHAVIFSLASVCIIWSELIKSFAPQLSVVSLTVVHNPSKSRPIGFGGQLIASAWILYMCSAALISLGDVKVWGNRALVLRNTYGESACWYAGQIARLTIPLSYNFLTFLDRDIHQATTFYQFLGQLINLTPLGEGFDYFFPILILLPVFATLFNLYGRVKNIFGFGLVEDEDVEDGPGGFGIGGWREGRELIERELNGPLALGLSSRYQGNLDPQDSSTRSRAFPRSGPSQPGRSFDGQTASGQRTLPTSSRRTLPEEEEDSGVFQSFAHRIKNTFETSDWLPGDSSNFKRPKWMSGSSGEQDETEGSGSGSSLGRWFGGRPAEGKLRV